MDLQESLLEGKKPQNQSQEIEFYKENNRNLNDQNLNSPLISIVIPVYNEENSIKDVLYKIPNHYSYEVVVVDDGSSDNSVKKIEEAKLKGIKLIRHSNNKGYGAALLTGIQQAKGDIIITMDSDGQHNPKEIANLIKPIINDKADIVVGSRYLGKSQYKVPLHTRLGELVIKKVLWYLFRQIISNNQSGFRAFTKNCRDIFEDMIYTGFGFCTEILFKASYKKFRIREVPITIYKRAHGASYVQIFSLTKAISSCMMFYTLKKFGIKRIIPKFVSHKIYPIILNYFKKIF